MKAHQAYQQNRQFGLTRIDTILGLYDGAIERLEKLTQADAVKAQRLTAEVRMIVAGFASGVAHYPGELAGNFLRLYEFVLHCLDTNKISDALQIVHTLHEGMQTIRTLALELERNGTIPPLDRSHAVHAVV
jgi:flagellin-specific chaperone FliS